MAGRSRSPSCASSPERTREGDPVIRIRSGTLGRVRSRTRVGAVLVAAVVAVGAAGCGSGPSSAVPTTASGPGTATSRVPLPAGKYPSAISKMVCGSDARREIAAALGLQAQVISTPTWVNHLYSCRYQYADGAFTLSVQELSSWAQTFSYFRGLAHDFGNARSLRNLGQGAFSETNGSVVVRKDWKVLTVDITGLPAQFGVPPTGSGDIAVTVADVILGCWAGD